MAQQARLRADERIALILFLLTAASVAIAVMALVVQVATGSKVPLAVISVLVIAALAGLMGFFFYRRTFR